MKTTTVVAALWVAVMPTVALALGIQTGKVSSFSGGRLGTSADRPGTNSLGTALPGDGDGGIIKGVNLGTNPAIAREEKKVQHDVEHSVCHGC